MIAVGARVHRRAVLRRPDGPRRPAAGLHVRRGHDGRPRVPAVLALRHRLDAAHLARAPARVPVLARADVRAAGRVLLGAFRHERPLQRRLARRAAVGGRRGRLLAADRDGAAAEVRTERDRALHHRSWRSSRSSPSGPPPRRCGPGHQEKPDSMRCDDGSRLALASRWLPSRVGAHFIDAHAASGCRLPGSPAYEAHDDELLPRPRAAAGRPARRCEAGVSGRRRSSAPDEPAAWANLGLAHLRLGDFDAAAAPIAECGGARAGSSDLSVPAGRLETSRGQLDEGIAALPPRGSGSTAATCACATRSLKKSSAPAVRTPTPRRSSCSSRSCSARPDNLAVVLERARLAAKRGDGAVAPRCRSSGSTAVSAGWPAPAWSSIAVFGRPWSAKNIRRRRAQRRVSAQRPRARATSFRESLAVVRTPTELIAEPFERFLRLPSPSPNPSPVDEGLTFTRVRPRRRHRQSATRLRCRPARRRENRELRVAGAHASPWPGAGRRPGLARTASSRSTGTATSGWTSRSPATDGVRLFLQQDGGRFEDATAKAAGSAASTRSALGVWAADIEMDGDLDLIVGVRGAAPLVLRNNGDGTWRQLQSVFRA